MKTDELRVWSCRQCGRSNRNVLADNGGGRCDFCGKLTSVQPSLRRGTETHRQLNDREPNFHPPVEDAKPRRPRAARALRST